jgi:hypothetical protein
MSEIDTIKTEYNSTLDPSLLEVIAVLENSKSTPCANSITVAEASTNKS